MDTGDHVSKDQVLAVLDPVEQQADVDNAKASLNSAEALLQQAKTTYERQKTLLDSGFTTRANYDSAVASLKTNQAQVDSARASLGSATEQLSYTDLKANSDGIVVSRSVEVGEVVQSGETVFVVAQDGPRDAVFNIFESLLTRPPKNKIVDVFLQSDPSIRASGEVREISPTIDAASSTVKVKIGLFSTPPAMTLGAAIVGHCAVGGDAGHRAALERFVRMAGQARRVARRRQGAGVAEGGVGHAICDRILQCHRRPQRIGAGGHGWDPVSVSRPEGRGDRGDDPMILARPRCGLPLATLLLLAAAVGSCDRPKDEPPPVRPVLSRVIEPVANQAFGPFAGTVEARYKTDLGFRAAGRMVSRDANVGDQVAKDAVLATLDPRMAALSLASSRADLANAQAQLVAASDTERRQSTLLQTGSTPQSQVDSAVTNKDTAKAKVDQAQAALTKAQEQLDFTTLRSDFAGVITNWSAEVGQVVSSGQAVVTVARPDQRDAVFDVPDDLINKVKPDGAFSVSLQADLDVTDSRCRPRNRPGGRRRDPHPTDQNDLAERAGRLPSRHHRYDHARVHDSAYHHGSDQCDPREGRQGQCLAREPGWQGCSERRGTRGTRRRHRHRHRGAR